MRGGAGLVYQMRTVGQKTLSAQNLASVNVPATGLGILSVGEQVTQSVITALKSGPKDMLINKEEVKIQGEA